MCQNHSGLSTQGVCTAVDTANCMMRTVHRFFVFFTFFVEHIITSQLMFPAKHIFALAILYILHSTQKTWTLYLPSAEIQRWSYVGVFIFLLLSVIKLRINLNLLFFHLSIPQLSCYGQINILIYKPSFVVEGPSKFLGATFIPFIVKCSPRAFMAENLIPLRRQHFCIQTSFQSFSKLHSNTVGL